MAATKRELSTLNVDDIMEPIVNALDRTEFNISTGPMDYVKEIKVNGPQQIIMLTLSNGIEIDLKLKIR